MSELGSAELVGSVVVVLLEFSASTAPSILRELADREADLVCCAGPSGGVGTSANVTLGKIFVAATFFSYVSDNVFHNSFVVVHD
jgi:hypothetical protein